MQDITLGCEYFQRCARFSANNMFGVHAHDTYQQTNQHAQTLTKVSCFTSAASFQHRARLEIITLVKNDI